MFISIALKSRHDYSFHKLIDMGTVMIGEARHALDAMRISVKRIYIVVTNDGYVGIADDPEPRITKSQNPPDSERGPNDKEPWLMLSVGDFKWAQDKSYLPTCKRSPDNTESAEMLALEKRIMNTEAVKQYLRLWGSFGEPKKVIDERKSHTDFMVGDNYPNPNLA